ncbi:hypothetical protein NHJ13734_008666 [Beauveria thailandica]
MSLTQKLVRTPSTSPPGNVSAVALVAADQIRQLIPESDISTTKTGPGVINVVAVIRSGCRGKRLVFSGHLDTYPTGDAGHWTLDPFSGELSSDGEKGRLWLEVEANGKAAHGAHVHRGSNAIDPLLAALSQLKYLEKLEIWPVKEVEDAIAAAMPVSESLGGPGEAAVLGSITVNIGTISGATSTNLVAQTASASLDIRLPMGLSTATLIEQIKRILEPADGIRHGIVRAYEASWTPPDEEITRHALESGRDPVGGDWADAWGADEYVEVAELVQVAQIHALTA